MNKRKFYLFILILLMIQLNQINNADFVKSNPTPVSTGLGGILPKEKSPRKFYAKARLTWKKHKLMRSLAVGRWISKQSTEPGQKKCVDYSIATMLWAPLLLKNLLSRSIRMIDHSSWSYINLR